jgi:transcription elongation regulator 1
LLIKQITWEQANQALSPDPRFNHPALSYMDKRRLFDAHIARLAGKRSNALHQLFQTHTPSLDTSFDTVYPKIIDDQIVQRLGLDVNSLEERWTAWMSGQQSDARVQFEIMLGENSFVDFWGKMRKKEVDEAAAAVKVDQGEEEEEEDEENKQGLGDGGAADLNKLAQQIDLNEIKAVLRVSHFNFKGYVGG